MSRGVIGGDNTISHHRISGVNVKCLGEHCDFCRISERIENSQNRLLGKILTIIDATITDSVQNKAIKDLIKYEFYEAYNHLEDGLDTTLSMSFMYHDLMLKSTELNTPVEAKKSK